MTDPREEHRLAIAKAKRHVAYVQSTADRALAATCFSTDVKMLSYLAESAACSRLDKLRAEGERAIVAMYEEDHQ
jgi:hypothetical protein